MLLALVCLAIFPGTDLVPAPDSASVPGESAASGSSRLPLVYPWGDTYLNITHELVSRRIPILEEAEGDFLRVQRGDLEVRYLFYVEEKIGDIILAEREEEGRKRAVLERLVLEPAHPKEEALLYAVEIRLPGLPMDPPEGTEPERTESDADAVDSDESATDPGTTEDVSGNSNRQSLLARLEAIYGPPGRNAARIRRGPAQSESFRQKRAEEEARKSLKGRGRVSAGSLEFKNRDTLVRVDYEAQGGRRYARRLSFVSRVISRERNRDIEKLEQSADRRIRKKIRKADRKLRRDARREARRKRK